MVYLTTLSVIEIMLCQMVAWLVNNELERIWMEVVVAQFQVLSWYSPTGAEENRKKHHSAYSAYQLRFKLGTFLMQVRNTTAWA
jgi:hypothetical protein